MMSLKAQGDGRLFSDAEKYLTVSLFRSGSNSKSFSSLTNPPAPQRLTSCHLLPPPLRAKHRTWDDRAFSTAAPCLLNSLPKHITDRTDLPTFRTWLKPTSSEQFLNVWLIMFILYFAVICFLFLTCVKCLWALLKALYKYNVLLLSWLLFSRKNIRHIHQ